MADADVTITSNVDEALSLLDQRVAQALLAIGLVAESHAKGYCPVDTGRLRNSISNAHDANTVYIGSNVEYAPYVELGTSKQAARPFLRPAVQNHADEYKDIFASALQGTGKIWRADNVVLK